MRIAKTTKIANLAKGEGVELLNMRARFFLGLVFGCALSGRAFAQVPADEATSAASPTEAGPQEGADADAEAKAHYDRGRKLVAEGNYDAALAEFSEARRLWPEKWAPASASAVCLKSIGRFDEAADLMTNILRDHAEKLPPEAKEALQREIVELNGRVGTIDIEGAEPGSLLTIDGQSRGEYPSPTPLRVVAGTHLVGIYKEGFLPLEMRVDVVGGRASRLVPRMLKLIRAGTLQVSTREAGAYDVIVDGLVVGTTPWEGPIAVGVHTVMVRDNNSKGSLPKVFLISEKKRTEILAQVEQLDASLDVRPAPIEASIAIDGIFVARSVWSGRLRPGEHRVKVVADGYFEQERAIALERGKSVTLPIALKRDPAAIRWREPARFGLEASAGIALSPGFGGEVAADAQGRGMGGQIVVHASYEVWNGFGFGASVGYLQLNQETSRNDAILSPMPVVVAKPLTGEQKDSLTLRSARAGVWASYRVGRERFRGRFRLGAGALLGTLSDERTGAFVASNQQPFEIGPYIQAPYVTSFYIAPEMKLAMRVFGRLELAAGLEALFLVARTQPRWDSSMVVSAATDGNATFPSETIAGPTMMVFVPSVSARYDF